MQTGTRPPPFLSPPSQPATLPALQISLLSLLAANPDIANPDLNFTGAKINLPCPPNITCRAAVSLVGWDSIEDISAKYNVTLQDLLDTNLHFIDPKTVSPGEIIYVPPCTQTPNSVAVSAVETARASCVPQTCVAQQGDKPGTVVAMFNMQIGDLYCLNPTLRVFATRLITAGQSLAVQSCPKAARLSWTSAQVCKSFYTVASGDTAQAVADKARTTIAKLMIGNTVMTVDRQQLIELGTGPTSAWVEQDLLVAYGWKLCILP